VRPLQAGIEESRERAVGAAQRRADRAALRLLKDADEVELKVTVPDADRYSAVLKLDLDVLDCELRQVVFFDTPDLQLNSAGVVVRARRARNGGDSVVKLRPVVAAQLPSDLRHANGFKIELDAMPGTFVCSGSLKARVDSADVKEVLQGTRPIRKLFSREQRAFYAEHAPKGLKLDALTPLGPINVARTKFELDDAIGRKAVAELWFYPDGTRILELSLKCAPDEAFQLAAQTRVILTRRGINPTGEQQTKTRKTLHYFSRLHGKSHH
jgi:hypothetical protein